MRLLACVVTFVLAALGGASAQESRGESPVVVEFYTSQGCVSCPPADAVFAELAKAKGVIALAMHVDYWDYLGWKDTFATPGFTARQKAYKVKMRQRTLFTPQTIIQGQDIAIGSDAPTIIERIAAHRAVAPTVDLVASRDGDTLRITLAPVVPGVGDTDVQLVTLVPNADVDIGDGENIGKTIHYTNIVSGWSTVAEWDGSSEVDLELGELPVGRLAIVIQRRGLGRILSAAMLD